VDSLPGAGRGTSLTGAPLALVVDDDLAIRLLVTRILERRGLRVDAACDGVEAVERIASAAYSVIVLDLMMPRLDGTGVMKYLAQYHPAQLELVVVMSAYGAAAADRMFPFRTRFIEKPFEVATLLREVGLCVDAASRAATEQGDESPS
jgi:CheY-like chemotaxis protein